MDETKEEAIQKTVRIGTRGSALALTQSNWVAGRIRENARGTRVELVVIKTRGDIMEDVSLVKLGGKGLFIKEIEEALLRREVDVAVHSMKDLPAELPEALVIAATPTREDPRDVLISRGDRTIDAMPSGARIGTCSLRRGLQLRNRRPDLTIVPLRGNLDTRIRKLETEGLDGVVVAAAGLRRMGWQERASEFIPAETMLPAIGQGVLAIETRRDDAEVRDLLAFLHDPVTWREAGAERAFLKGVGGGCQFPIAGFARCAGDDLTLAGLVGSVDGRVMIRRAARGPSAEFEALGHSLAAEILAAGGRELLAALDTGADSGNSKPVCR